MDSEREKRVILFVTATAAFLTPFMGSSINIALPTIGEEFSMDAVMLSWVATSFILTTAVFLLPSGRAADIIGRKRVFTAGIMVYAVSTLVAALSRSALLLIISRVIQGAGCAMMFGTGAAILTSVFPAGERGKALGINVTSVYAGLTLGPFLGGFLTQHLGWRSIFWLNLALATMAIALVLSKMKGEWAEAKGERFDFKGSIVYALSLSLLMFGFSNLPEERGMWLAAAGVAGILVFIKVEIVTKSPVLEIALFRKNAVFAMSNLAAFVNYSATFAAGFLMSLYLQYIRSYTPQNAGLILATYPVAMAFFSPFAGGLSDRVEPRFVASAGMLFTFVSLIMLSFTGEKTPIAYIISSLTLLGTGIALFSSPNANAIMSSVERKFYGVASASIGTMRLLGQMFSMGIATLMISFFIGNAKIRPENHGEFVTVVKTAFLVFGAICFFGIFASFARGDVRKYDLKGESK